MINKYDALDWQTFSQKKDIEEIVNNTKEKNNIQVTAVIEIAMWVSSIVAENLFKNNTPEFVWILILIVSIAPLIWLAYKYIKRFVKKNKVGSDIPDLMSMVNLFDNDICYYALMAESYSDKLKEIDTENITEIDKFYFIETCFYINKTIYNLSITANSKDNLYSSDVEDLYINRKISKTRLKNIFNIVDNVLLNIENYNFLIESIDEDQNYSKLIDKYKESYTSFKKLFKVV